MCVQRADVTDRYTTDVQYQRQVPLAEIESTDVTGGWAGWKGERGQATGVDVGGKLTGRGATSTERAHTSEQYTHSFAGSLTHLLTSEQYTHSFAGSLTHLLTDILPRINCR